LSTYLCGKDSSVILIDFLDENEMNKIRLSTERFDELKSKALFRNRKNSKEFKNMNMSSKGMY